MKILYNYNHSNNNNNNNNNNYSNIENNMVIILHVL